MAYTYVTRSRRLRLRTRDFQLLMGLSVAALSAAVVWLAVHTRHAVHAAPDPRVAALAQRAGLLQKQVTGLRSRLSSVEDATVAVAAQTEGQADQLAQLRSRPQLATTCVTEIQQEVDDIRGYIAFGTTITRRVTGDCAKILAPRFGG